MSLKGNLLMLMASMAMMGGNSAPSYSTPKRKSNHTPRNLSPEEMEKLKADRLLSFSESIVKHNAEMGERFKGWKTYKVNGFCIVSSNIKNAHKTFTRVMKDNCLAETDFVF